jgi:hypothetical protein
MKLSDKNVELAYNIVIGKTEEFNKRDDDYKNLMLSYLNDVNSSSLREAITCYVCGYTWNTEKHGEDGINPITNQRIECKPKLHLTKHCNGGGVFNDMTIQRIEQHLKDDIQIVCSIFSHNRLIYVVEFPFADIAEHIKYRINERKKDSRSSPSFSYTSYMGLSNLKIHYVDLESINNFKCLSKNHYRMLIEQINGNTTNNLSEFLK